METGILTGPQPAHAFDRYRADLAGIELSSEQQEELLSVLWTIMSSMVELGFSVDVCGLLLGDFNDASAPESGRATLPASPSMETPSDGSGEERQ